MEQGSLSHSDHRRIADAIRTAECNTSGEIYCVLARRSDTYFFIAGLFAAVVIMAGMLVAAIVLDRGWLDPPLLLLPLAGIAALSAALALLALFPHLRILMVPRYLRYKRASANAAKQFLSRNIHRTDRRTGVLIFVSLEERYAEVVADAGVNARVPQQAWNEIVAGLIEAAAGAALADGFADAVAAAGKLLAEHFPPEHGNANELDDHLAEI